MKDEGKRRISILKKDPTKKTRNGKIGKLREERTR